MPFFFCRLNPPRPSFATDMTEDEMALMGEHGQYWSSHLDQGSVVLFGLVAEPSGPWGACVVDVNDEAAARALTGEDPVIRADRGFSYDVFAMPNAVTAKP